MKVLTAKMIAESFDGSKDWSDVYVKYDGEKLYYTHPETASFDLYLPTKIEQLTYFVRFLASLCYEEQHFEGARIWFTEVGVWNELLEGIGYQILESMNTAAGQPMSFWEARGYQFRADELVKTLGVLIQPLVFGWDAYYLPFWSWGGCSEYFLQVSHDSVVRVTTRSRDFHDRAIKSLVESGIELYSAPDGKISRYISKSELPVIGKPRPGPASNS
jgi:hypothetical protein